MCVFVEYLTIAWLEGTLEPMGAGRILEELLTLIHVVINHFACVDEREKKVGVRGRKSIPWTFETTKRENVTNNQKQNHADMRHNGLRFFRFLFYRAMGQESTRAGERFKYP